MKSIKIVKRLIIATMNQPSNSRATVYVVVLAMTAIVWILRGIGLLAFLPGFVLWILIFLSIVLTIVNGLIEVR
ncbi:MAG: hypothetical protein MUC48_11895 [Leptolyngbya sp. Prado105]|jgi:hypothetical protein|nr:hypothetical protein [Leptolyngbya sp. Prado105]